MRLTKPHEEGYYGPNKAHKQLLNGGTQLLNATGIEGGIQDRQVLKYQPSVTSRLIFRYLMESND